MSEEQPTYRELRDAITRAPKDWVDGSKTGDLAFIDNDGLPRYRGRTRNVYGSADDVVTAFTGQRRRGATVYVYRTTDGLFDGTVIELTDDRSLSPEFIGADLVLKADKDGVIE